MIDPYPPTLIDTDLTPAIEPDPTVRALNRLAQAIEQLTLATLDARQPVQNAPQRPVNMRQDAYAGLPEQQAPRPALATLPPVTVVAQKPPCPAHGLDKVLESKQFAGFYCAAKAAPGQPQNARGYCTWQFRTQA